MIDKEKPVALKPCRSPYCECTVGQCTHPGCYDARHEAFTPPAAQLKPLIPASLAEQQFERYYRRGYDAGFAAQRKPLTWDLVRKIGLECANDPSRLPYEIKIARAVEAAHGIKEKNT